ncbi:MAG: carbon-nitrogen hydrolase family protein [Isosphaeraceae bacterium]|nr:carbon-nitrogen hydrolase family protein [Isosphaeraceae bacterium]
MTPTSPSPLRVAAVQMLPIFADVPANLDAIVDRLEHAVDLGARLVVFPECAATGYGFDSVAEAMPHAETIPGPGTEKIAQTCKRLGGVHAIYGLLERDGDRLFNACVLVGPDGVVGSYRKVHLPYLGVDRWATPGDRPFAVHEVEGVRVGMHICYDGGFPEPARVMSLLGADLLVLPTNWPRHAESAAEHMPPCRAMENVVYFLAVNRIGEERGFTFIGRSSIAGPNGEFLAMADAVSAEVLLADVDPAIARRKRLIRVPGLHEVDRIADRRPGFYGPIVEPNGRA